MWYEVPTHISALTSGDEWKVAGTMLLSFLCSPVFSSPSVHIDGCAPQAIFDTDTPLLPLSLDTHTWIHTLSLFLHFHHFSNVRGSYCCDPEVTLQTPKHRKIQRHSKVTFGVPVKVTLSQFFVSLNFRGLGFCGATSGSQSYCTPACFTWPWSHQASLTMVKAKPPRALFMFLDLSIVLLSPLSFSITCPLARPLACSISLSPFPSIAPHLRGTIHP